MGQKLSFCSDYMEGAHPAILERLVETNLQKTVGYGFDEYSENAREKIKKACQCPNGEVHFLIGGTQTNTTVISSILHPYQGVIAAETGHISVHEAGAIEYNGHKVLTVPHTDGKISAEDVRKLLKAYYADESCEHMVMPGMVYISHPTEYGTLYTRQELIEISNLCKEYQIPLYLDGARLAYALACPENELTLPDLAKYCDAFYIGGTKCGALFGEAVVFPKKGYVPHFFSMIKQHGALLAKGRIAGIQFDTLFTDDLYTKIGTPAMEAAAIIRKALDENGYKQCFNSPTNQIFCIMEDDQLKELGKTVEYGFWEKIDDTHTIIRFATSWATTQEDALALADVLKR